MGRYGISKALGMHVGNPAMSESKLAVTISRDGSREKNPMQRIFDAFEWLSQLATSSSVTSSSGENAASVEVEAEARAEAGAWPWEAEARAEADARAEARARRNAEKRARAKAFRSTVAAAQAALPQMKADAIAKMKAEASAHVDQMRQVSMGGLATLDDDCTAAILRACTVKELRRIQRTSKSMARLVIEVLLPEFDLRGRKFWNLVNVDLSSDDGFILAIERCAEAWKHDRWAARSMCEVAPESLRDVICNGFTRLGSSPGHSFGCILPADWENWLGEPLVGTTPAGWNECLDEPMSTLIEGHEAATAIMNALQVNGASSAPFAVQTYGEDAALQPENEYAWAWFHIKGHGNAEFGFRIGDGQAAGGRMRFFRIGDDVFAEQLSGRKFTVCDGDDESEEFLYGKVELLVPGHMLTFDEGLGDEASPRACPEDVDTCMCAEGDLLLTWFGGLSGFMAHYHGSPMKVELYLCKTDRLLV